MSNLSEVSRIQLLTNVLSFIKTAQKYTVGIVANEYLRLAEESAEELVKRESER